MKVNSLIVGYGDVGHAIADVLTKRKNKKSIAVLDIKDKEYNELYNKIESCDVMHICIRYTDSFVDIVKQYIRAFKPQLVIIHSTVAIGTTDKIINWQYKVSDRTLGKIYDVYIVHSPVQGQHDNLTNSVLQFKKIVGTVDDNAFKAAKKEMNNLKCVRFESPRTSELAKFFSTSYYGICLAWTREMNRLCKKYNVSFDEAGTKMNQIYNEGYSILKPEVVRPTLTPPEGPIGGHCVVPNAKLLLKQTRSKFLKLIR